MNIGHLFLIFILFSSVLKPDDMIDHLKKLLQDKAEEKLLVFIAEQPEVLNREDEMEARDYC